MPSGSIFLLKLILTPALIGVASLAGRRWGQQVSGWLIGLPFTSGPVAFFLALSHGTAFAAAVATGILTGTISTAAYGVVYAWLTLRFPWPPTQLTGCVVFGLATVALQRVSLPLPLLFVSVLASLVIALLLLPRISDPMASDANPLPSWDIPARMIVATAFVVLLTGIAPTLGPRLSGLLAPFPLYASILAVFAHHHQGAHAAIRVLRGLLVGLFAFATFFLTVAGLIERVGLGPAFAIAIILALLVQGVSLGILHWEARHHASRGWHDRIATEK